MSKIKSKFTLHTDLKEFVPGPDQPDIPMEVLSPRITGIMPMILGGITVAMLLGILCNVLLLLMFAYTQRINYLYFYEGHRVPVVVTSCKQLPPFNNKPNAFFTFTYTESDVVYEARDSLYKNCDAHPIGSTIEALYHDSEPSKARINIDLIISNNEVSGQILLMFGSCLVVFIACLWGSGRRFKRYLYARRHRRALATRSQMLPGEITAINGYSSDHYGSYYVRVWYEFTAPNAKVLKGYAEAKRYDLKDNLPPTGTPVTVIYADNGSHMML